MKKIFTLFFVCVMLITICPINNTVFAATRIWDGSVANSFASGIGTSSNPYVIKTASQLAYFAKSVNEGNHYENKYVVLENDICLNAIGNLKEWDVNPPRNSWTPIGKSYNYSAKYAFWGNFNGKGHTVSGLYINSNYKETGLFGYVFKGKVENVAVKSSYIRGGTYTGGISGYAGGSIIQNCYSNATVKGSQYAGGILGSCMPTEGNNWNMSPCSMTISNCCNEGNISSTTAGGISGEVDVYKGSYSTGGVYISNLLNLGLVNNGNGNSIAYVHGSGYKSISNCYYLESGGIGEIGTSKTSAELKKQSTYSGFNFSTVWGIDEGKGYPYLRIIKEANLNNNNTTISNVKREETVIEEENKIVFNSSNNTPDSDDVTWENKEVTVSTEHHSHGDVAVKNSKLKITDSGQHIIGGTLTIDDGGVLELTGKLVVTNLVIKGSGKITVGDTLAYCNPVIDIKNDFTISSNHDENVFKKGKMYIGGNFTQKEGKKDFLFWNSSRRNFECESGFEVIFFKGKDNPGTTNISFESGKSYFNDVIYDEELEKITYKVDGKTITTGKKSCIKGKEYYAEVNVSPLSIRFLQSYTYTQSYGTKIIATEKIIDIAKDCADKLGKILNRDVLEGLFSENKSVNADQLEKVIEACITSKQLLEHATYDEAISELFGTVNVEVGGQKISIRIEGFGALNNSATFGRVSVKKVKKGDENTSYQLAGTYTTVDSDEFIDAMMEYEQEELKRMINTCYSGLTGEKVVEKLTNDLMEDYCNAVIEATYGKPASALYSTKSRAMLLSAMCSEEFIEDENLRNCIAETLNIDADAITADDMSDIIELDISGKDISTLSGLEYATNLTSLNAENNNITDISPISYLPIEKLLLGNNRISEFAFYNSSLLGVDLHRNNLSLLDVSACTNLQELNVESNLLTTADVENIKTNTTLEYLAIGNNDIDNIDFISYLTGIKVLNLNELYLADVDILNISGLSELYSLALSYNCIEDLSFMEELYNIELLDISHTQVKDLSVLNQLYYLKNLNVSGLYYLNDESTELLNTLETNGIIIQQISFDKSIQYMSIPEEIVIGIGDTFVVSPVIMPLFADEDVLWSTTDENIATINEDGTVVAVGQGECDVVAAAEGNALSVVCKVRVADKHEMFSVNVDENVVTIALHSINNDGLNNESNIVLAYYKGNMMTHCEIVAGVSDMISGAAEDVECTIPNGITYDTIKLFVLRSAISMKPICTYKKINIY